eukprot:TRINITY_DN8235_c0_g1_i1.p1 TRINITY_DN8235_c0_g1~~TRINITY_DN8235_c0_g1_i1.p1  ORF type:complete len:2188 (+),score=673.38 TRINITY_DN8235_c0_g1_i1:151-6714(+)
MGSGASKKYAAGQQPNAAAKEPAATSAETAAPKAAGAPAKKQRLLFGAPSWKQKSAGEKGGAAGTEEAAPKESNGGSGEVVKCPAGHDLDRGTAPVDNCSCDSCKEGVAKGAILWGCRVCNYDLCEVCRQKQAPERMESKLSLDSKEQPKRQSRASRDVAQAKNWSRAEVEQLSVPQLLRWLEALGTDISSAVRGREARAALWHEVQTQRPPALAGVNAPEHMDAWPLQEILRWLEHFGKVDDAIVEKQALVQLLLKDEESLPPPSFLGESAEDQYLTQVQRNVATVKGAATTLLNELHREISELETQQRAAMEAKGKQPEWYANGLILESFSGRAFLSNGEGEGNEEKTDTSQIPFLDMLKGEHIDYAVFDTSGWAWCVKEGAQEQGWIPTGIVVEVARVSEGYNENNDDGTLILKPGEELQVKQRHYSGWTLCARSSSAGFGAEPRLEEGWVPDHCLSDHPRNGATKQHRLILNGVHRLAEEAYNFEMLFYRLRTQGTAEGEARPDLRTLYDQVVSLIDEYRGICEATIHAQQQAEELAAKERAAERHSRATRPSSAVGSRTPSKSIPGIPDWVYPAGSCLWKSKTQGGKHLAVTVKKICQQRRQVLVIFDADASARKIVSFESFKDLTTCPLLPPKRRRRKRRRKGDAECADDAAQRDLAEDLRGMMEDLGSLAGSSGSETTSSSSSGSEGGSSYTATTDSEAGSSASSTRSASRRSGHSRGADGAKAADDAEPGAGVGLLSGSSDESSWSDNEEVDFTGQLENEDDAEGAAKKDASDDRASSKTTEEEDSIELVFEDLCFDDIDEEVCRNELLEGFQSLGAEKAVIEQLRISLRAGSVVAEIFGPPEALAEIRKLPLSTLKVLGKIPDKALFSDGSSIEPAKQAAKEAQEAEEKAAQEAKEAQEKKEAEEKAEKAANVLQRCFRGFKGRARATVLREEREEARKKRRELEMAAAVQLKQFSACFCAKLLLLKLAEASRRNTAATKIQAAVRQRQALRSICCLLAKVVIQPWIKAGVTKREIWRASGCMDMTPEEWLEQELLKREQAEAIIPIQAMVRCKLACLKLKRLRHKKAAVALQSMARKFNAQMLIAELREEERAERQRKIDEAEAQGRLKEWSTQVLVRISRRFLHQRRLRELQVRDAAATRICATARGHKARKHYAVLCEEREKVRKEAKTQIHAVCRRHAAGLQLRAFQGRAARGCITGVCLRYAALANFEKIRREVFEQRRLATIKIQSIWRGCVGREKAKVRRAQVEEERRRKKAASRIQGLLRIKRARAEARKRRWHRLVVRLQKIRRGVLGRRRAAKRRVEAFEKMMEAIISGKVSAEDKQQPRDAAWLQRMGKALDFKEQIDRAEETRRLVSRRAAEAAAILEKGVSCQFTFCDAVASMDRGLAASRMAAARDRARNRAVLISQVDFGAGLAERPDLLRAFSVEESLMARLSVKDAVREMSAMVRATWAITASCKPRHPEGIPKPADLVTSCMKALGRRMKAELAILTSDGEPGDKKSADQKVQGLLYEATQGKVVDAAKKRAKQLGDVLLLPLKKELKDNEDGAKTSLDVAQRAMAKIPREVEALKEKQKERTVEAEKELRQEREKKHAQTCALHDLAMQTQVEKERLEACFLERKPKPVVLEGIVAKVKSLQSELKDLEVNGTSNRKSQGILAHTLRALEVRASKAELEARSQKIYLNEADLVAELPNFKVSAQVLKKQERQVEQEQEFRTALEAEVRDLKAKEVAHAAAEVAELGFDLRKEAEEDTAEAQRYADLLSDWRKRAAEVRPWLSILAPMACAEVSLGGMLESLAVTSDEGLVGCLHALLQVVEAQKMKLVKLPEVESPREPGLDVLVRKLQEVKRSVARLKETYPEPTGSPVAKKKAPSPIHIKEDTEDGSPGQASSVALEEAASSPVVGGGGLAAVRKLAGKAQNEGAPVETAGGAGLAAVRQLANHKSGKENEEPLPNAAVLPPPPGANPPKVTPDVTPRTKPPAERPSAPEATSSSSKSKRPSSAVGGRGKQQSSLMAAASAGLAGLGNELAQLGDTLSGLAPPPPPSLPPGFSSAPGAAAVPLGSLGMPPPPPPGGLGMSPGGAAGGQSPPPPPPPPGMPAAAAASQDTAPGSRQRPQSAAGNRAAAGASGQRPPQQRPPTAVGTRRGGASSTSPPEAPSQGSGMRAARRQGSSAWG